MAETETGTIVAQGVDDHGECDACQKTVDVIVDPFQVVGKNKLICIPCRAERIRTKAVEDRAKIQDKADQAVAKLESDAEIAREDNQQSGLEFPVEE